MSSTKMQSNSKDATAPTPVSPSPAGLIEKQRDLRARRPTSIVTHDVGEKMPEQVDAYLTGRAAATRDKGGDEPARE